jgi:hypothetical protein
MAKSCKCCGHPNAKSYGKYNACNLCNPKEPTERISEAYVRDGDIARKAKVRELTYKCNSTLCGRETILATDIIVLEWIE